MSHHIPARGQKDLDNALRAIKARNGTLQSPSQSGNNNFSSSGSHTSSKNGTTTTTTTSKTTSVFGNIDDDDEADDNVVKHVPQGLAGGAKRDQNRSGRSGFGSAPVDESAANRLVKPGSSYYGDKIDRQLRSEEEMCHKLQIDQEIATSRSELNKIKEMIIEERENLSVCIPCKRKFSSKQFLNLHKESEPHKKLCTQIAKSSTNSNADRVH